MISGLKTATSRLGDRSELYAVDQTIKVEDNVDGRFRMCIIHDIFYIRLRDITLEMSGRIGAYTPQEHMEDFCTIYPGSTAETFLTYISWV